MKNRNSDSLLTYQIHIYGIVQGVGFRPTVCRHAATAGICGTVCNKGSYVEIIAQGDATSCETFFQLLKEQPPVRATILHTEIHLVCASTEETSKSKECDSTQQLPRFEQFSIIESAKKDGSIFISPDLAICEDCKRELFDKKNRRYLHPFINCTNCGPRMTILDALPYDRERTSMHEFPMCAQCEKEYHSPKNRRFDAQPVCCNDCGPNVYILNSHFLDKSESAGKRRPTIADNPTKINNLVGKNAITHARKIILSGGIVAVKGIGGFHLCCDATNEAAVSLLRERKHRPTKPFAVMMRDWQTVEKICLPSDAEKTLLTGHQKPIVLLHKRTVDSSPIAAFDESPATTSIAPSDKTPATFSNATAMSTPIAPSVAPDNPKLGVMLPYAPIQLLLFDFDDGLDMPDCLIMTSGNDSGAPICRDDKDALLALSSLADAILSNNRLIRVRADDTVTDFYRGEPYLIRRSRGFAPLPVFLSDIPDSAPCVLGIGGELKNSFCIGRGQLFYPSPYIGDLSDSRTVDALKESVARFMTLLEAKPKAICCDLHPLYHSKEMAHRIAKEQETLSGEKVPVFEIQHHYAHILSCMAENDYHKPVIGVSFDGTGYGTDRTIWGGEILLCDWNGFTRISHIMPFLQVGGDASSREGWRIAAQMIDALYEKGPSEHEHTAKQIIATLGICKEEEYDTLNAMAKMGINTISSTSAGRLFDAVSAILGIKKTSTFEGEASTALMYQAMKYVDIQNISEKTEETVTNRFTHWTDATYPLLTKDGLLNTAALVKDLIERKLDLTTSGSFTTEQTAISDTPLLAYHFHKVLSEMIAESVSVTAANTGIKTAALCGGVFQNTLLLQLTEDALTKREIRVLRHHLIPPNDGGIGLGQAVYAAKHLL